MCDTPSDINLSSSAQSSLWLVLSISLCICIIALILTHHFHAHRIFFSSNRLFMTTSVMGAIMVSISAGIIIPSTSSSLTSSTCTARVWMLFLGLHLFFSSLCVKLYKLHAIFTHTKITAVHVPDKRMLIWCGLSSIPLLLVLIIWAIIAPWQSSIPCDDDSGFMYHCHNTQRHIFLPLLLSLIGVLLFTLAYYIYHTYRIPYRYKDTTRIAVVLTNALITFVISISVYASFRDANRPVSHLKLIWVVSMLYGVASSIMILYVPMCYQLMLEWRTPDTMNYIYESKQQDESLSDMSHHMGLRQRIPHPATSHHSHLPWSMASAARPPPMDMDIVQRQRDREMEAVDQRIASGNATMEEKLTHLMNRFDAQSTRMLSLQHEESELLMLAMRKRTEMMALRQSCLHLRMEIEYLSVNAWTQQQTEQQIQQQQQEAITQTWRLIQQQQQQQIRERQLLQMVSVSHGTNQQPHTGISQTMSMQPSTTATSSTRIQTQTYTSTMGSRGPLESLTVTSGIRQPYHNEHPISSITSLTNLSAQAAIHGNVASDIPTSGPTSTTGAASAPPPSTSTPTPPIAPPVPAPSPSPSPSPIASSEPDSDVAAAAAAAAPRFHF